MRVALHSILRAGHEDAYERDHAAIPADLLIAFERLGIRDWTIWRSGRDLFHLVECDDFAAAMRALAHEDADRRWQEFIGRHVDHFVGDGGDGGDPEARALGAVWDLRTQRRA